MKRMFLVFTVLSLLTASAFADHKNNNGALSAIPGAITSATTTTTTFAPTVTITTVAGAPTLTIAAGGVITYLVLNQEDGQKLLDEVKEIAQKAQDRGEGIIDEIAGKFHH